MKPLFSSQVQVIQLNHSSLNIALCLSLSGSKPLPNELESILFTHHLKSPVCWPHPNFSHISYMTPSFQGQFICNAPICLTCYSFHTCTQDLHPYHHCSEFWSFFISLVAQLVKNPPGTRYPNLNSNCVRPHQVRPCLESCLGHCALSGRKGWSPKILA